MKVIIKRPGEAPQCVEIENSLQELQKIVGGHIKTVTFASDACVICNEEGRLKGLPYNITFCGYCLFGPVIFVGIKGEEFTDFPNSIELTFSGFEEHIST